MKKFRHIVATESSIIYCWVFGQLLNIPPASTCILTSGLQVSKQVYLGYKKFFQYTFHYQIESFYMLITEHGMMVCDDMN